MIYPIAISLGLLILFIITLPFTILIHELGHALPLLLLTKQGVTVFVGSYGDVKYCFCVPVFKLDIWIRYDPLKWKGGLCISKAKTVSPVTTFIFVLCGPLFSLLAALLLYFYLHRSGIQSAFDFICAFTMILNAVAGVGNLFPFQTKTSDNKIIYSDGYRLFHLKALTQGVKLFNEGCKLFNEGNYREAVVLFEKAMEAGYKNENVYRPTYLAHLILQDYVPALQFLQKLEKKYSLDANDYYNYGFLGFRIETNIEPNTCFQKALKLNPNHINALNAAGYRLIEKNALQEALPYFDKAIQIDPNLSYAYNNRGFVKLETGLLEEGLADVLHSIALNDQNAYAYRNQGIYHLKKNEPERALQLFEQAKQMDNSTHLIEELIKQATVEKRESGIVV